MVSYRIEVPISTYYVVNELKIGNCTFFQKEGNMWMSTTVEANGEYEAKDLAIKNFKISSLAWSFILKESLAIEYSKMCNPNGYSKKFTFNAELAVEINDYTQKSIVDFSNNLKNADEYAKKATVYFQRGLATKGSPNDSYLNFYKVCELIAKILD